MIKKSNPNFKKYFYLFTVTIAIESFSRITRTDDVRVTRAGHFRITREIT